MKKLHQILTDLEQGKISSALICNSTHYWQYFAFVGTIQLELPEEVENWGAENILIFDSALECQSHINSNELVELEIKQNEIEL